MLEVKWKALYGVYLQDRIFVSILVMLEVKWKEDLKILDGVSKSKFQSLLCWK